MQPPTSSAALPDRFAGCLLGLTVGDALGAPYEGLTSDDIFFRFGSPDVIVRNPSGDRLYYTDDTQMMIGVAETLADAVPGDRIEQLEDGPKGRGYIERLARQLFAGHAARATSS